VSKARAKGTEGENYFLPRLQKLFGPNVSRAPLKGVNDYGDFLGVPWLHEAKNTIKPLFMEWARVATKKAGSAWVILWKGDLRRSGTGPYVVMPIALYELLVEWAYDNWAYGDRDLGLRNQIDALKEIK
jgi:hypothetical protein